MTRTTKYTKRPPRLHSNGYRYLYLPGHPLAHKDGYVAEHRLVVHDAGFPVTRAVHVHHINGDKTDNRLENLAVKTPSDHHREHVGEFVVNQYGTWKARVVHPHGDYRRYIAGCRCDECRQANTKTCRERRQRKALMRADEAHA